MRDEEIEAAAAGDPDAPPLERRSGGRPGSSSRVRCARNTTGLRTLEDVLAWFRARGPGYQTRINAVLRAYVEAHSTARTRKRA
jgi:uncharacterized protein (DUF4415 family)